jgi:hypothetical protein
MTLIALVSSLALAQAVNQPGGQDLEYRTGQVREDDARTRVGGLVETQWHEYDNLDFRPIDESSDQAILDSDDRGHLAFTGAAVDVVHEVDDHTEVAVSASLRGLWGNDQVGTTSPFGGWMYFNNLYLRAHTADDGPSLTIGRQYFEIGGLGGTPDYVLADVLDFVRADVPVGGFGRFVLIPANVVAASGDDAGPDFLSYVGQSSDPIFNLRGARVTFRTGAVIAADELPIPVDVTGYGFFTKVGARGTGADISYGGELGNFSDEDWVLNAGIRGQAEFGIVRPYAHFDLSMGADRKELVASDADTTGYAWGAGIALRGQETDDDGDRAGFDAQATYFDCLGPAYAENGLLYSHGYVGMKGRQVGGLIMNRYLGWHPTAYVGSDGISDSPHDSDRKSGTRVLNAGAELALSGPLSFGVGWWFAQDTGITYLAESAVDTIQPPYGYSRSEFAAEFRHGRTLGQEIDATVTASLTESLDLVAVGGVLLPGAFYELEIDRVAGNQLGAADPATSFGASGSARVRF